MNEVTFFITENERDAFEALNTDLEREAFIREFWRARDPDPETPHNATRERFAHMARELRALFAAVDDERLPVRLVAGAPQIRHLLEDCGFETPILVWRFGDTVPSDAFDRPQDAGPFSVTFRYLCEDEACEIGTWRIWSPSEELGTLLGPSAEDLNADQVILRARRFCHGSEDIWVAIRRALDRSLDRAQVADRMSLRPPENPWWESRPAPGLELPTNLDVRFPGRYLQRAVLDLRLELAREAILERMPEAEQHASLLLEGDLFRSGRAVERFQIRFHLPLVDASRETIALELSRHLEPASYDLALRLYDGRGQSQALSLTTIDVPPLSELETAEATLAVPGSHREVLPAITVLEISPLPAGLQVGPLRVDSAITGPPPRSVEYLLDGNPVATAEEPPYSATIDLGSSPRSATLEARAIDQDGTVMARDEARLNAGPHRFTVRLLEPSASTPPSPRIRLRAAVRHPRRAELDRLELYLEDELATTLHQPPFVQTLTAPPGRDVTYVKAIAYLEDGRSAEDAVILGAAGYDDEIEVDLVEVLTTVVDRRGKLIDTLGEEDFAIFEGSDRRELVRFQRLQDLPLHLMVLLDVSSSMAQRLKQARSTALSFFEQVVTPRDRVAFAAFRHETRLVGSFTRDVEALRLAAGSLQAWGGTALYDSVIQSLYHFGGLTGARALVIISDGADEHSRFDFDQALDYSRRAGVMLYTISLPGPSRARKLRRLAEETGGRHFKLDRLDQLGEVYSQLERELRSQYLLTFQPPDDGSAGFRAIRVELAAPGLEARSRRGYYRD